MTEHTKQRLSVNNAPDLKFAGRVVYEYSTQSKDQSKPRWTELRLWETEGGAWIAESLGCSTRSGESDLRDVLVIEPADTDIDAAPALLLAARINQVMNFFGWSTVAKAFARKAGWNVVREVA